MREDCGCVVDCINKARLIILEGIYKGAEALVNLLVRVLSLAVYLRVVGYRQLKLRT